MFDDDSPYFSLAFSLQGAEARALARDLGRLRSSDAGLSVPSFELLRAVSAKIESVRSDERMMRSRQADVRCR